MGQPDLFERIARNVDRVLAPKELHRECNIL
jgi:hypothetical protein